MRPPARLLYSPTTSKTRPSGSCGGGSLRGRRSCGSLLGTSAASPSAAAAASSAAPSASSAAGAAAGRRRRRRRRRWRRRRRRAHVARCEFSPHSDDGAARGRRTDERAARLTAWRWGGSVLSVGVCPSSAAGHGARVRRLQRRRCDRQHTPGTRVPAGAVMARSCRRRHSVGEGVGRGEEGRTRR